MGDFFGHDEGYVALAAFYLGEVGAVNLCEVCKFLLGEFLTQPQLFNTFSESLVDVHDRVLFI